MTPLSKQQLQKLQERLEQQQKLLIAAAQMHRNQKTNYREIAGEVHDRGDESLADILSDIDINAEQRITEAIADATDALERMQTHHYGICIDCGQQIGFERLNVFPTAKRCLHCRESYEKTSRHAAGPSM